MGEAPDGALLVVPAASVKATDPSQEVVLFCDSGVKIYVDGKGYCFSCSSDEIPLVGPSGEAECIDKAECSTTKGRYLYDDGNFRACLAASCADMADFCAANKKCGFTALPLSDTATGLCVASCGPIKYVNNGECVNNCEDATGGEYKLTESGEKECAHCEADHYVIFDENIKIYGDSGILLKDGAEASQCVDCKLYLHDRNVCSSKSCSEVSWFRSEKSGPVTCYE